MPFQPGEIPKGAIPFKKGESGNPKGRPKLPDLRQVMAEILGEEKDGKTALMAIVAKLRQLAANGNIKAAEVLLARGFGLPKEHKEITITNPVIIDWTDTNTADEETEGSKEGT